MLPWLGRLVTGLSPLRPGFASGPVRVGFVVDKVALGQAFLRVLRFTPSISLHHGYPYSYIIWGMKSWWPQFRDNLTPSTQHDMNEQSQQIRKTNLLSQALNNSNF
jgi:hypothetical protein